jgi:acyl-CoA synthetase (AMP-forming)/AMP-acid ligase II
MIKYEETVIGIYSLSDLDYLITILGLGRLGYTPFMLSPRLPPSAVAALLTTCKATTLFLESSNAAFASSVREFISDLKSHDILTRTSYDSPEHSKVPLFERENIDLAREHHQNYLMLHSSGSTGLPKPITWSNRRILIPILTAQPHTAFQSVPFSHAHGLGTYVQAIYARKTL